MGFLEKKFKMADSKKLSFSTTPKAEQFLPKFHELVLGIVRLIDAKAIDVAQSILSDIRAKTGKKCIFYVF